MLTSMDAMRNKEDFWDHPYYWLTKTSLRAIGHWPYQSRKEFIIARILVQFVYWIQVIPEIVLLVRHHYHDLNLVLETTSVCATHIAVPINLCTLLFYSDKMKFLLEQVKENWGIFPENNGLQLLHQYTDMGRLQATIYSGCYYSIWVLYMIEPLHVRWVRIFFPSNESLPLRFPIPVDYGPLDIEKYYFCIMIMGAISLFAMVAVLLASDILIFLYAQHACGLFAALGFAIENLPVDDSYHQGKTRDEAYQFSKTIEDIYCWNFFTLLGLHVIIIGMNTSQIVASLDSIVRFLRTLAYTLGLIAHLFIQCAMSQQITDKSLETQQSLMNAKWYCTSAETRQLIEFMTMRARRPCQLTAGRVISLSIAIFGSIIRMAATYATVFLGMQ